MLSLSIVTPSFNQGRFIERTLQSVLQQNISKLEYIVMDGGSNDETLSILQQYDSSINWVSKPDRGQSDAINQGFKKASGDIIGWLNSDDIYYPGSLATILEFFENNPNIDMVYGDAFHIDANDKKIEYYPTEPWSVQRLKQACFISQPAVFFRRRIFSKYGLLNENLNFCMDYEYWLRLALKGAKIMYIPTVLAGSRLYPETKTSSSPLKFSIETMNMLRTILGYVPNSWLLKHAILQIQTSSSLRFPSKKYLLATLMSASFLSFEWNGLFQGIKSFLTLPKAGLDLVKYKKKLISLKVN